MNMPAKEAYPVLCGELSCGRLINILPSNMMVVITESPRRAEILGKIKPFADCQIGLCDQQPAKGYARNPDVVKWLEDNAATVFYDEPTESYE